MAMNALGYDAMTVGNHEYSFGLAVLRKRKGRHDFRGTSANTYKSEAATPSTSPMS